MHIINVLILRERKKCQFYSWVKVKNVVRVDGFVCGGSKIIVIIKNNFTNGLIVRKGSKT